MSKTRQRALQAAKDARGNESFLPITTSVLTSDALAKLSPYACKLLLDIMSQTRLGRNGDASAAYEKVLRPRGWRSKSTLYKAIAELRESGLIIMTRQGTLHLCSLYALGWLAINDCGGKLDIPATRKPLNSFSKPFNPLANKKSSTSREPNAPINAAIGTARVLDG